MSLPGQMEGRTDSSYTQLTAFSGTWANIPSNSHYPPHSHSGLTTHLIRRGTLTITYPEDNANGEAKETFGLGARVDVPAGKLHEVWIGDDGCEYVIGE